MITPPPGRPQPTRDLTAEQFIRWYWLKSELVGFARLLAISPSGDKETVTARIVAALSGTALHEAPRTTPTTDQLSDDLTGGTAIPTGQRCSQRLRAWFHDQVGPGFRFDAAMRHFFATTDGSHTLDDALHHWRATRGARSAAIGEQFEYNRFTRAYHSAHPGADRPTVVAAWTAHRNTPVDRRPTTPP